MKDALVGWTMGWLLEITGRQRESAMAKEVTIPIKR
jgi:hypothetical protein